MRRQWITVLGIALAIGLLIVAALPWWLGLALPPLARRYGVQFERYERIGYARFALHHVIVRRGPVVVRVDRAECDSPVVWSWRHLEGVATAVTAGNWVVDVEPAKPPSKRSGSPSKSGWMPLRATLRQVAGALDRWLPVASFGAGRVNWPGGGLTLRSGSWSHHTLTVEELQLRGVTANVTATFTPTADRISIEASTASRDFTANLASTGSSVRGKVAWADQPADLTADFGPEGWLPERGLLDVPQWRVPGGRVRLPNFATVQGHVHLDWEHDHFLGDISVNAQPAAGRSIPPVEVTLHSRGTPQEFTIDALHIVIPGITAELTAPVTIERSGEVRGPAAKLAVRADLAQVRGIQGTGTATGEARIVSNGNGGSSVEFDAAADDVAIWQTRLQRAEITGRLRWPQLEIARLAVNLDGQSNLNGSAGWNFQTKELTEARIAGELGPAIAQRFVPAALRFERVSVQATASGRLDALGYAGKADVVGFSFAKSRPCDLAASWQGVGPVVSDCSIDAKTGTAEIRATGAADAKGVRLTKLALVENGQEQLRLRAPALVRWRPALAIERLQLEGPEASANLDVRWGRSGRVIAELRQFQSKWINDWYDLRGPSWAVPSLAIRGTWNEGPMTFSAAGGIQIPLGNGRMGQISVSARGDDHGVQIDAIHANEGPNPVVNGTGHIPILVEPGTAKFLDFEPDGALRIKATTVPNAAFWQQLAALTGVELLDPEVAADLSGTWLRPRGTVQMRAARVAVDAKRFVRPVPSIEALKLVAVADTDGLRLEEFGFRLQGQPVSITGRLPLAKRDWSEFTHDPMAFLRRDGALRIEIPDADVAMFSRFLPAALAPAGRLQADLQYTHGVVGGYVRIRNAASRPLGPLGVLQQVNADVELSDRRVVLREVRATAGGQPVVVAGTVDVPEAGSWLAGAAEPKYHVTLRGENLPFVRQSGLLVRGDLNLKLESPAHGPPSISGNVTLRDSLFLSDVRSFLPHGGGASPSRRPPYFAIDTPPLNSWGLAIDVTGTRFMRLRTPVFAGLASAHFRLTGTLGAPRAIGEATIDQGNVLMPFATFAVQLGSVRLTEEDPYEPTIYLRGTGRHYGYDLTLEITGRASAPKIDFTSSPALGSEQVLLMVMTGAAPSNDVTATTTHRAVQIGAYFGEGLLGSLTGGNAGEERLTIESGEKISLQGKETYDIEYKLNDRWALTGEYDEFDEYNAGFKWRVAPKRGRKGEQLDGR